MWAPHRRTFTQAIETPPTGDGKCAPALGRHLRLNDSHFTHITRDAFAFRKTRRDTCAQLPQRCQAGSTQLLVCAQATLQALRVSGSRLPWEISGAQQSSDFFGVNVDPHGSLFVEHKAFASFAAERPAVCEVTLLRAFCPSQVVV